MLEFLTGRVGGWLAREWVGLPLAGGLALLAAVLEGALGWILWPLAALFACGNSYHLIRLSLARRRDPPPGLFFDINGAKLHLLAEGSAADWPPVILLPGGYGQGLFFAHTFEVLKSRTRVMLFDHAGQGYSGPGRFPRSVERIVDDLHDLLSAAGETGPFVLIGHSFGGLISASYAYRHPSQVAGLVCLDATPPVTMAYPSMLRAGVWRSILKDWLVAVLGLAWHQPDPSMYEQSYKLALAPWWSAIRAGENRVSMGMSMASAVQGTGLHPDWLVQAPGALGDLPVLSITQDPDSSSESLNEIRTMLSLPEWKLRLFEQMMAIGAQQYAQISGKAEHERAPPGTGHNFPYEDPEFTHTRITAFLDRVSGAE